MKVYVLAEIGYDQFDIRGVFATIEAAKAAASTDRTWEQEDPTFWRAAGVMTQSQAASHDWWIEEHEVDVPSPVQHLRY
jgi:hypothetical protein